MPLLHCFAALDQSPEKRRQAVLQIDAVCRRHFNQDYSLYYEALSSNIAAQPAKGKLYFLVATAGQPLPPEKRSALAADLKAALDVPQSILFQTYPLDAVAKNGQYLADIS